MHKFRILSAFLLLSISAFEAPARQYLSEKDIVKIKLAEIQGGISRPEDDSFFEIVPENGTWKTYRVKDSLHKTLVGTPPQQDIAALLQIINVRDTILRPEHFDIQEQDLITALDSVMRSERIRNVGTAAAQKNKVIQELLDGAHLANWIREVIRNNVDNENTRYSITVIMRFGKALVLNAVWGTAYNLPWTIQKAKLYDPNISRIFNRLIGSFQRYDQSTKRYLCESLAWRVVRIKYESPFAWENLKIAVPQTNRILGRTLQLKYCTQTKYGWSLTVFSTLLPKQLIIGGSSLQPAAMLPVIKLLETKMVKMQKQQHYLFKYLQQHPGYTASAHKDSANPKFFPPILKQIKTAYKKPLHLPLKELVFVSVVSPPIPGLGSAEDWWILLPDQKIMVVPYRRPEGKPPETISIYDQKGKLQDTIENVRLTF